MKEQQKCIKVLHIMNGATLGGISTVVLNYYRHMDRERFHFDLAMPNINLGPNGITLRNLGCGIFQLPLKSKHPFLYAKRLYGILTKEQYDAIHVHSNVTSFYPLIIALLSGTCIRIAHAHTAMIPDSQFGKIKRTVSSILTPIVATKLVACSSDAAKAIFGKKNAESLKTIILNNAINTDDFSFHLWTRNNIRRNLRIEDQFVLGCVGNLGVEKNQIYALRILNELEKKKQKKYCLLVIGDGPLTKTLKDQAFELEIGSIVHFLGKRTDVKDLLQAMDAFLMPSLYEGFPLAALEAAASGLPLFLSDTIPKVFTFYPKCMYLPITINPEEWANKIIYVGRNNDREKAANEVKRAGYDLLSNVNIFESLYK